MTDCDTCGEPVLQNDARFGTAVPGPRHYRCQHVHEKRMIMAQLPKLLNLYGLEVVKTKNVGLNLGKTPEMCLAEMIRELKR